MEKKYMYIYIHIVLSFSNKIYRYMYIYVVQGMLRSGGPTPVCGSAPARGGPDSYPGHSYAEMVHRMDTLLPRSGVNCTIVRKINGRYMLCSWLILSEEHLGREVYHDEQQQQAPAESTAAAV